MEEFEFKGHWWLPESPSLKVAGTLKFHPLEGAFLVTEANAFAESLSKEYGVQEHPDGWTFLHSDIVVKTICGITNLNKQVTLYMCAATPFLTGFRVHTVFIGWHFEREEDIIFDSISLRYPNIERWVGITGFTGSIKSENPGQFSGAELKYSRPERVTTRLSNLAISFDFGFRVNSDLFVDTHLTQVTYVEIKPHNPSKYTDFRTLIFHWRNFLSLGMGIALAPLEVIGRSQNFDRPNAKDETQLQDVYIYYVAQGANLKSEASNNLRDMLFRYKDLEPYFQQCVENWFVKAEKILPIVELYFGLFYLPSMYIGLEFLILTQVLEAYHRRMYAGEYMDTETYKEAVYPLLIKAIPSDLHKDHKESLKSRMQYGYDFSLRKRLNQIVTTVLEPYQTIVEPLIRDKKSFISSLVDTRNYLTHYNTFANYAAS